MPPQVEIVILAGGTGGAKLARGMQDVVGAERLAVVANPGDDIEIYGAYVSPDPDLISFWLADLIDARGWGLEGDTFNVMDGLRALGVDVWFNLGDRDLAWCVERTRLLAQGLSPTAALGRLNEAIGVHARVLPASDDPVRTWVLTTEGWRSFQDFMIRMGAASLVEGLEFRGAEEAAPSPAVLEAIAGARAIVIGPSNPLASIGPILAIPGIREALLAADAPVLAVSPIVGGEVLKGPTAVVHGVRRAGVQRPGRGRLLRRAARRDRRRRAGEGSRDARYRHPHGRGRRPRVRSRADTRLRRLAGWVSVGLQMFFWTPTLHFVKWFGAFWMTLPPPSS